jgi:hypothetical protein
MSQARPGSPLIVKSVTVTIDGVTHHGTYYVQGSVLHVRSPLGAKTTNAGMSPPEAVARLLLSELVRARPNGRPTDLRPLSSATWSNSD